MIAHREGMGVERRRLVLIFALAIAAVLGLAAVAMREVRGTTREVEEVLSRHAANALEVSRLQLLGERVGLEGRSFLLSGDAVHLTALESTRQAFQEAARGLAERLDTEHSRRILDLVSDVEQELERSVDRAIDVRRTRRPLTVELMASVERDLWPARKSLDKALEALRVTEEHAFQQARAEARFEARASFHLLLGSAAAALVLAGVLAWALARTLTRLARSRAALDASLEHLECANRDLDAFAGRIAHDLRNILAPLPFMAERIRRSSGSASVVETSADRIEGVARRADGLMNALLAFARSGQPPQDAALASVRQAADQAAEDLTHMRTQVGANLAIDVEDGQVRCAPSLLYTVIANLLTNALKFVDGRPRREVRVCGRRRGDVYQLSVEDSGPGIPSEEQPRIFQPFYRSPRATAGGTGIGLATVHRIVEGYGGRVFLQSRMDEGTTFTIELPVAPSHPAGQPVGGGSRRATGAGEDSSRRGS